MAEKDALTKEYMQDAETFADAFNFLLYDGKQVIRPERLKPLDTTAIALPFGGDGQTAAVQKYRDVLKMVTAMEDGNAAYLLLGVENQTDVNAVMPVRNMLYDSIQYSMQVTEIAKSHRKSGDKPKTSEEFLSGFYRTDKLIPVITLTLYFGAEVWTAPKSLHEMLKADEEILRFVDNYHLHLIEPAAIQDGEFEKFHTELREVLQYIKYSQDKQKLDGVLQSNEEYKNISRRTANLINVVTNSDMKFQQGEERVDMCEAIRQMRNDAWTEGNSKGKEEGKIEGIAEAAITFAKNLLADGTFPLEKIASLTGLSLAEVQALANGKTA